MTATASTKTDVLIVGSGPVGLFLATECARRNLRFRIVEQRANQSEHSKALLVAPRTMELFDMAGFSESFVAAGHQITAASIVSHGRAVAHMQFEVGDTPYDYFNMVPQDVSERLLLEVLRQRGGNVEYETKLVDATQTETSVDAVLQTPNGSEKLRASYVVGCDGAHSTVRHLAGLGFEGGEYPETFVLADADFDSGALPEHDIVVCPNPEGMLLVFPIGDARARIIATVDRRDGDEPTLDEVNRILERRGPAGLVARNGRWTSYFTIHHRQTPSLCSGRLFVAGDAAHIHSPAGGQGMNTGLGDVWNLAWKLDLTLRKRARASLLDSYSDERRPVIARVIAMTDRVTRAMTEPKGLIERLRDAAIPMATKIPLVREGVTRALSELGVDYHESPLVEDHGRRYFTNAVRAGALRDRFLVVAPGQARGLASARALARDFDNSCAWIDATDDDGLALVRPDGYAAYASHAASERDFEALTEVLSRYVVMQGKTSIA